MKSKALLTIFYLIIVSFGQFYNQRTKCIANRVGTGREFSSFMLHTQFNGITLDQLSVLMGYHQKLMHHGFKVTQNQSQNYENHRCKNYFMSKDICCRYSDLNNFTNKLLQLYRRTYFLAKHPMVDYIYKIYDQYKLLDSVCLNNFVFNLPGRHDHTLQNSTQPLNSYITAIANQLKIIKQHEIDFIINTACIFCVGTLDMKTFIHPSHSDSRKASKFIYNQQYFSQVTKMIAQKMIKAKQSADLISSYIINTLRTKANSATICTNLTNMIFNDTQINKRKVCDTYEQCLKFAQQYIGEPAAPAYSKAFASIQLRRTISATNFKVITSDKYGFKGNHIYDRYEGRILPKVYFKGNQYQYK